MVWKRTRSSEQGAEGRKASAKNPSPPPEPKCSWLKGWGAARRLLAVCSQPRSSPSRAGPSPSLGEEEEEEEEPPEALSSVVGGGDLSRQ